MNQPQIDSADAFQQVPSAKRVWPAWAKTVAILLLSLAIPAWWLLEKMPEIFGCPSRPCPPKQAVVLSIGVLACTGGGPSNSSGFTSYSAVLGQNCAFRGTRPVSIDEITDGQSNTLIVGECTRTTIPWTKPDDIDIAFHSKLGDPAGFGSPHSSGKGVNFGFADGRVDFLSTNLPQATVDAMFTRNGGDSVYDF